MSEEFNNWSYNRNQTTYKMWEPQIDSSQESAKKNTIRKNSEMMINEKQKNS